MSASLVSPEAKQAAADLLRGSALAVRASEVDRLYCEDFGLGEYEETGLAVLELVNTDLMSIKILVLLPHQTCPEHRHRPVADYPGKEETIRCQWGECTLSVPGAATPDPGALPPAHRRDAYTVWHQIRLGPGEQHTCASDTRHWFQAGPEGAVVWSLCSRAVAGMDEFKDRDILGPTRLGLGRR